MQDKKGFGDVSTNAAFMVCKGLKLSPGAAAKMIIDELSATPFWVFIESAAAAGNGFINFTLKREVIHRVAEEASQKGAAYGTSDIGNGKKVLIEYVSANPTGPLTVAHGRQAAVGDALARILTACGFCVTREYYLNDRGRQIDILGLSTLLRYLELLGQKIQFPEDGYQGSYVTDIARKALEKFSDKYKDSQNDPAALKLFSEFAVSEIMDWIKKDLADFGVMFDVWFSELSLADSIEPTLAQLKNSGHAFFEDGAWWLKSTAFGDDKDRVLVKNTGQYTYLSPDLTYHKTKYARGFEVMINLWGPDHHGYVPRLKAGIKALGYDPSFLTVLIVQLTTLYRGKEKVSMSTRAGSFISLREVMDEVGADATRFFFLNIRPDSHFDFDLELAKKKSVENPVYYLQYAHARICSIFKKYASEHGVFSIQEGLACVSMLAQDKEIELLKIVDSFSREIETAAAAREPNKIITYLMRLCGSFHSFYNEFQVVGQDPELTKARMLLCRCVKTVLENGLRLLGINAPETM